MKNYKAAVHQASFDYDLYITHWCMEQDALSPVKRSVNSDMATMEEFLVDGMVVMIGFIYGKSRKAVRADLQREIKERKPKLWARYSKLAEWTEVEQ